MADCAEAHAARRRRGVALEAQEAMRPREAEDDMTTSATVTALFVYPVKSMRAVACESVRTVATGLEWDRQWMLIDARGTFLSQRTHPKLACCVPQITPHALVLSTPGLPPLTVPLEGGEGTDGRERVAVRVHRDACVGIDEGRSAAEWVSEALGEPLRLVRVPKQPARVANREFAGAVPAPMGFADGFPLLVCNEASLDDLNRRLPEPIPMERFRPNIVLAGLAPWAEDHIDTITLGTLTLHLVKPCTRCTIPSIDQRTGMAASDPAPVLRTFRFDKKLRGVTFGENAVIASGTGSAIERGAACRVTFGM
jgi:uncharacterized protein YcbX